MRASDESGGPLLLIVPLLALLLLAACAPAAHETLSRDSAIPGDAVKRTPATDPHPPILHSDEFEQPIPLPGPVNTAGAEDSPFIPADEEALYFFFTPDVRVPVEKQVIDRVTGIYVSRQVDGIWRPPERVWLQEPGKLSLDGCEFIRGGTIWFCAAREGHVGLNWFTAGLIGEQRWEGVTIADPSFAAEEVGELHIHEDAAGSTLYFHSSRAGGKGGYDLWAAKLIDGVVQSPVNLAPLNTAENEGWPYVSADGQEMWFTRTHLGTPAIMRSRRVAESGDGSEADSWGAPELIVSQFAGEPTFDKEGNLYFIHHYFENGTMLEADIYVAYRRR